jgi:hypothetical protein
VGLQITGPGGGQWTLEWAPSGPVAARRGLSADRVATCHMNSRVLAALTRQQLRAKQAVYSGSVVIEGDQPARQVALDALEKVVEVAPG